MRRKRFLLVFVVVLVIGMLFQACGAKPQTTSTTAAPTSAAVSSSTASTTEALAPYTVDYVIQKPQADMSDQPAVEDTLNSYMEKSGELPNTKIHFTFIDGTDFQSKVSLMTAANQKFDLLSIMGQNIGLNTAFSKGVIAPIDDLLKDYAPDIMKRVNPDFWPAVTIKGQKIAIPHPFVVARSYAWAFKKDLVDKYKFDAASVTDISQMEPFLAQIKANEPGITGLFPYPDRFLINKSKVDCLTDYIAYNVETNQLEWVFDDLTVVKNAITLNDFYKKGYVVSDYASKKDNIQAELKTGKYAIGIDAGEYDSTSAKSTKLYGYQTQEVLSHISIVGTAQVDTVCSAVSATSQDPKRAMMFQNLLYKDKTFANMVGYGKEGLDYTVTAGAGTDNPTVQTIDNAKWAIWICWISPLWDQWNSNWNSTEALQAMQNDVANAKTSPLMGFLLDTQLIKSQDAQLEAIYTEAVNVLTSGSEPDAKEYLAKIKTRAQQAGLDATLQAVNQQIDTWKSSK